MSADRDHAPDWEMADLPAPEEPDWYADDALATDEAAWETPDLHNPPGNP